MDCRDVREWLPAHVDAAVGRSAISLTERALVQAHLGRCADCRGELERLQQLADPTPRAARLAVAPLLARLRRPVRVPLSLAMPASVLAILALVARAVYVADSPPAPEPITHQDLPSTVAVADAPPAPAPEVEPTPPASTLETAPADAPAPVAEPIRSAPRPEPKPKTRPVTAGEPSPSREVIASATLPASSASRDEVAVPTDVVGQLQVRSRDAAERELATLLARVGGTELGSRDTAVLVVIPQSRYAEFADGLTRIGAWQIEAGRSPLPDPVRMRIRLGP